MIVFRPSNVNPSETIATLVDNSSLPPSQDQFPAINVDHDYATGSRTHSKKINSTSTNDDHNYAGVPSFSSRHPSSTAPTSLAENNQRTNAINSNIQDFTFLPNYYEQFDLLTFFANIQQNIEDILTSRIRNNAIKWYISIQVELIKDGVDKEQTSSPHFRSTNYTTLNMDTFDLENLIEAFQKMFESFEKFIRESSGWVLKKVVKLIVHTVNYSPLKGSSFVELPHKLKRSTCLLNIRNMDQKCFLWSCLASIHPLDSPLVSDYEPFEHELNMSDMHYPITIDQITKFEKQNPSVSVNVFTFEDKDVLPLRITQCQQRLCHINLLLIQSEDNSHYVLIKNINRFLSYIQNNHNTLYYCVHCLHGFTQQKLLDNHIDYCQSHDSQKIELPSNKDCFLEFKDYEKTLRVPYVIYADFETLNKPLDSSTQTNSTVKTQLLEPCSFGYKVICTDPNFTKDTVLYRGLDASKKLLECLLSEDVEIQNHLKNIKPLNLSISEEVSFQSSQRCCLCNKLYNNTDIKVRHHDHVTGKYIGAAHTNCNLQAKQVTFIPVIFHNLKNFDAHLLCQSIGSFKNHRIKCIPQTIEKYISFSIGNLRFIDSLGFLPSSLETLVDNLSQGSTQPFKHFNGEVQEHTELLLRKGVYPYEYMTSWEKFEEGQLPPINHFYSTLTGDTISEEDYNHAKHVFKTCKLQNLGDYHDLYLKTDVLLLADVFENFRDMSQTCYDLDPCHFYTSPGLSWQAMLKMTGVTLELLTDIEQVLFIEKGIRGGISQISNRYKKANNPHLDHYDPSHPTSFLAYYDVNNLYGFNMSQKLPTGFFTFLTPEEIDCFDIRTIPEDGSKGYILEVDLEYPENLHDSHNDFPLAPEGKFIPNDNLSFYAKKVLKKLHNKTDALPPRAKTEKLLTTLENKENYVLHYKNLQLYLQLGLKLKRIHRILEFQQEAFMKPYVEFNTNMRQKARSTFEKNFFKLMNNSVFGKLY